MHDGFVVYLVKYKYPKAKPFHFKPLANMEELKALFGEELATGSKNWSSK